MSIIRQGESRTPNSSPTRMTARERRRRETQERIRNAAYELFERRGFEATTVDEIAEAAGVSRRTFFNHFPNKDDVVSQQFESFEHLIRDAAQRFAAAGACPYEVAWRAASEALQRSDLTTDDLRNALRLMAANRSLAVRVFDRQLRWEQAVIDAFAEVAPDRYVPDETAAAVASAFAVLRAASLRWATEDGGDLQTRVGPVVKRLAPTAKAEPER